jgi:hypothetical protein
MFQIWIGSNFELDQILNYSSLYMIVGICHIYTCEWLLKVTTNVCIVVFSFKVIKGFLLLLLLWNSLIKTQLNPYAKWYLKKH